MTMNKVIYKKTEKHTKRKNESKIEKEPELDMTDPGTSFLGITPERLRIKFRAKTAQFI